MKKDLPKVYAGWKRVPEQGETPEQGDTPGNQGNSTDTPENQGSQTVVNTGDSVYPVMWVTLLAAVCAFFLLSVKKCIKARENL